mgnify:FL=1
MKFIEKVALILLSIIGLIFSIVMVMLYFNIISATEISNMLMSISVGNVGIVMLVISLIIILLAIKCLFFGSKVKKDKSDGILLENANGKLLITKETLENLVSGVSKNIIGTESITSKVILDKENNLSVLITITIDQDANIKDLSNLLQTTIKDAIKQTADLDVKEVNVKVKNINMKQPYKMLAEKSEVTETVPEPVAEEVVENNGGSQDE